MYEASPLYSERMLLISVNKSHVSVLTENGGMHTSVQESFSCKSLTVSHIRSLIGFISHSQNSCHQLWGIIKNSWSTVQAFSTAKRDVIAAKHFVKMFSLSLLHWALFSIFQRESGATARRQAFQRWDCSLQHLWGSNSGAGYSPAPTYPYAHEVRMRCPLFS